MKARLEQQDVRMKSLEAEVQNTRDDLLHKQLLLEELSGNPKVEPENNFLQRASESSERG